MARGSSPLVLRSATLIVLLSARLASLPPGAAISLSWRRLHLLAASQQGLDRLFPNSPEAALAVAHHYGDQLASVHHTVHCRPGNAEPLCRFAWGK
jgi:hypothetical protein